MPHINASRSSRVGESVSEVLRRIPVRDPNRKPTNIYGRRITDYQSHAPLRQSLVVVALAALVAGTCWIALVHPWTGPWSPKSPEVSQATPLAPTPTTQGMPPTAAQDLLPEPGNLHVHFWGPRTLEFYWDPIGQEYSYRLYADENPQFRHPQPLSEDSIQGTDMTWLPDDHVQEIWVAMKGIDPQGRETAFSRPLLVQLPNE